MSSELVSAKLIFASEVEGDPGDALGEEVIILVLAQSEEEAWLRARRMGVQREHSYVNEGGARVAWKSETVGEVQDLCETSLFDGMEVYSRMFWK